MRVSTLSIMRWLLPLLSGIYALFSFTSCTSKEESSLARLESLDSLSYVVRDFVFQDKQFSNDPAIQSKYSFSYIEFTEDLPQSTKDSLLSLMATFLAGSDKKIHAMPDFKKMADDLFKEFAESAGEHNLFAGWEINRSIRPAGKLGILQSIECSEMSYLGGAHPNSVWVYQVVDLSNGKTVRLSELIAAESMEAFNRLRFKKFESDWNSRGEDLKWQDYFFPESFVEGGPFYQNENFYVRPEGITFFYNQYEIAPYASGVTELTLPWKDLEPLLNKKSAYYPLLVKRGV